MKNFFEDVRKLILFFMILCAFIYWMFILYDIYKYHDNLPNEKFSKVYLDGKTYKIPEKDIINNSY